MSRRVDSQRSILRRRAPVALALLVASVVMGVTCSTRAEGTPDRPTSGERGGPRVAAVAGVGFPRPFAIEGLFGMDRTLAVGIEYSFLPVTSINGIDTSFAALAGDARYNPRAGFFWMWKSGLAIGMDFGVQIPLSSDVSSTLPSNVVADRRVTSITSTFATDVIPTFDLLRIGMAF